MKLECITGERHQSSACVFAMFSEGKLLEGQAVTLEDGTTAVVQGTVTPKRKHHVLFMQCCIPTLSLVLVFMSKFMRSEQ